MASPKGTVPHYKPVRRNILREPLRERCVRNESESWPVQNLYGSGLRDSSVPRGSYSRSLGNQDQIEAWQQGEMLPTTPVQNFYGSGPRPMSRGSNSRSRLQDDVNQQDHIEVMQQGETLPTTPVQNFYGSGPRPMSRGSNSRSRLQDDGNQQEDHIEVRQQGETLPTTSRASFSGTDLLANEVARLKMTVDLILEGQRSMEKSFDELRSKVQKLEEGLHGESATQRRKRRTSLSLQV